MQIGWIPFPMYGLHTHGVHSSEHSTISQLSVHVFVCTGLFSFSQVSLTGTQGEEISVAAVTPAGKVITAEGTIGQSLAATVTCSSEANQSCKFTSD